MLFGTPLTCPIGVVTSVCPIARVGLALDAGVLAAFECAGPSSASCCSTAAQSATPHALDDSERKVGTRDPECSRLVLQDIPAMTSLWAFPIALHAYWVRQTMLPSLIWPVATCLPTSEEVKPLMVPLPSPIVHSYLFLLADSSLRSLICMPREIGR